MSSSQGDVVPHMIIRSLRLQPGKFVVAETKRLLQHYLPAADIRDDVNERERPPCGGLSKVVSRLHAVLAALTTLPWISERPVRRCGSPPAQPVAGRASGRDWSVTRRL